MIRTRALVASVLAAGLTTPLTAVAPYAAAAPGAAQSTVASSAAAAPVLRKFVAYGDEAVWTPKGSRLFLSFEGRRGDLVTTNRFARLFSRGRAVRPAWEDSDLHRLPRNGRFTFRVPANRFARQEVSLVKARVHDLAVDGRALRTSNRRGYIDLAAMRLRRGDRVTVDSGRDEQRVYLPDGTSCVGYGGPLLLRPGHDIRVANDVSAVCDEALPGRTLVRVRSGRRVTAARAVEVAAQPDGAPVTVSAERRALREVVLTFDGAADDLVYVDDITGARLSDGDSALNRWGATHPGLISHSDGGSESFVIRTSGATEVSTVTDAVRGSRTATVRLRKGIRVADLVTDGPAFDIALDGSGTRLYSFAIGTGRRLESTSRDLGADEGWSVELGSRSPWTCGHEPGGPMGCADNGFAAVSASVPVATSYFFLREPVAVALPAPGATGTVSLRLVTASP
ncbi:hypothetical protein CFI00_16785 [Nocardioides sp. S5]|uniref:hypothetical protein n=1 Tax=Nocardioides sp. S5 TaxID=2017486 RepID=UPI001A8E8268|nr:hypothetical protein [Nocardioides sp. S5]QSR32133.1 hypothetical protein CFI00_16785 [Nocardioides sp. S5]